MSLVLASGSAIRRTLLANAGVEFTIDPADVDEAALKQAMRAQKASVEATAVALAAAKAMEVSRRHPDRLVLGADQMLDNQGDWLDKPADMAAARRQLERLAGHAHRLVCGAVVVEHGREVWRHADAVTLHMRPLSAPFLEQYLDKVADAALKSVGAYQLEGLGAQLFERIEGDYFTVLGLPLLPLLAFLRGRGIIPA